MSIAVTFGCSSDNADELRQILQTDQSASIESIDFGQSVADLFVGESQLLSVLSSDQSGARVSLNNGIIWQSIDPAIASVSADGRVQALNEGSTRIEATYGELTDSIIINVSAATAVRLDILPTSIELAECSETAVSAIATYTDGNSIDVTTDAGWSPEPALQFINIEQGGAVRALTAGAGTLTADWNGLRASTIVTVSDSLSNLAIQPKPTQIHVGETVLLSTVGRFNTNEVLNVTRHTEWQISSSEGTSASASIEQVTDNELALTAMDIGTAQLSATCGGLNDVLSIQVVPAPSIESIRIAQSPEGDIETGTTYSFEISAVYSDGTEQALDSGVRFSMDGDGEADFRLRRVNTGWTIRLTNDLPIETSATLAAAYKDFTTDAEIVAHRGLIDALQSLTLIAIDDSGNESVINAGDSYSLSLSENVTLALDATYTSGSRRVENVEAVWSNLTPSVATVDANGVVQPVTQGSADFLAVFDGVTTTVSITITD